MTLIATSKRKGKKEGRKQGKKGQRERGKKGRNGERREEGRKVTSKSS